MSGSGRLKFMVVVIVAVIAMWSRGAYTQSDGQPVNDLPNPIKRSGIGGAYLMAETGARCPQSILIPTASRFGRPNVAAATHALDRTRRPPSSSIPLGSW